jgi:hypothetical protein
MTIINILRLLLLSLVLDPTVFRTAASLTVQSPASKKDYIDVGAVDKAMSGGFDFELQHIRFVKIIATASASKEAGSGPRK